MVPRWIPNLFHGYGFCKAQGHLPHFLGWPRLAEVHCGNVPGSWTLESKGKKALPEPLSRISVFYRLQELDGSAGGAPSPLYLNLWIAVLRSLPVRWGFLCSTTIPTGPAR